MDKNNYKISFVRNCDQKAICCDIFRDKNIDMKTKGFYGCIISLPDTQTHLSIREMMELVGQGELVVRNAITELIKFGYCERNLLTCKGKRVGVEYVFYEKSLLDIEHSNIETQKEEYKVNKNIYLIHSKRYKNLLFSIFLN